MNGIGFAYFRWHSIMFGGHVPSEFVTKVRMSTWRDLQQRALHRKMAKPKDKRA